MKAFKIAIIGLGPKGLYGLERLLAQLAEAECTREVEIHLFEKCGYFGCGEIYDLNQPDYLLMNFPNRNINVWPNEHPKPIIPDVRTFVEWLAEQNNSSQEELLHLFSPRKKVGEYLQYCYGQLKSFHLKSVQIFEHVSMVSEISRTEDTFLISCGREEGPETQNLIVDKILLTTGHSSCDRKRSKPKTLPPEIPNDHFIGFIYPVQKRLNDVPTGSVVGIKGLGLTFIDAVLALTEGRGGKFKCTANESLIYLPSGNEPKMIVPFSKSGMPMIPRSAREGLGIYDIEFFTIDRIKERTGSSKRPSFAQHILPLLIAETEYRYYKLAFEKRAMTLYPNDDFIKIREQIDIFHEAYPEEPSFEFGNLFDHTALTDGVEYGNLAYMRQLLRAAKEGSEDNPYMRAAMTWSNLSDDFNEIYSHGGMTPDSHWLFDKKYRSKLNRISYGPPLENFEKLIVLMEMGLINFEYAKNPRVEITAFGWTLVNTFANSCDIDVLIDARIPTNTSPKNWCPLFVNMQKKGIIRPMQLTGDLMYTVGCPEINGSGQPIDSMGQPVSDITFYGTPTEGATYDNDTLSRKRNDFASRWAENIVREIAYQTY